jgi:hypothetical protein
MSVSVEELRASHEDLARHWRPASAFRQRVNLLHERCPSRDFKSPGTKFLLDAWIVAEFTLHKDVDRVRLSAISEQWPDAYAGIGANVKYIEATSADIKGRKIWAEYQFEGERKADPVQMIERAEEIPVALERAIRDKVEKHYGSKAWLVVYLNINEYGIRQVETEKAIIDIKQKYIGCFDDLFVIWKDKLL